MLDSFMISVVFCSREVLNGHFRGNFDDQENKEVDDTKKGCPDLDVSFDLFPNGSVDDLSRDKGIDLCEDNRKNGMLQREYALNANFPLSMPASAFGDELGIRESCNFDSSFPQSSEIANSPLQS